MGNASDIENNVGSNIGSKPKKRLSKNELRGLIIDACPEWDSLEHIDSMVGENSDYLITKVFPSML